MDQALQLTSLFESGDFGIDTFRQLISLLDQERLHRASTDSTFVEPGTNLDALNIHWVESFLQRISECLIPSVTPASHVERELQARAISCGLGLLSAGGVESIQAAFFDRLNAQLKARFEDLHIQAAASASGPLSIASFRQSQCAYLLCSNAAFLRRFRQAMPIAIDAMKRAAILISSAFAVAPMVAVSISAHRGRGAV